MKIRNGFVSNSSTSSFILIGYKVKDADYEKYQELDLDFTDDEEEKGYCLVGKEIAAWDEEDYSSFSISWEKIEQIKKEVKEKMGRNEEPQLSGGIRLS